MKEIQLINNVMDKEDSIVKIMYSPADTFRNQDPLCRYIYCAICYFSQLKKKTSSIVCASLFYTVEIDVIKHFNIVTVFVAILDPTLQKESSVHFRCTGHKVRVWVVRCICNLQGEGHYLRTWSMSRVQAWHALNIVNFFHYKG